MRHPTTAAACTRNLGSPCNSNTNGTMFKMPSGSHARNTSAKVNEHRPMTCLKLINRADIERTASKFVYWKTVARTYGKPGVTRLAFNSTPFYLGRITLSITWMTPLLAAMSVAVTLALSTMTPPSVVMVMLLPSTVFTGPALTSAAITFPATT